MEVKTADGTWTFKGWDKEKETVNGENVTFTGAWSFTPNPEPGTHEATNVQIPKAGNQTTNVQTPDTGDRTPIELYTALMAISAACVALLARKRRRRER